MIAKPAEVVALIGVRLLVRAIDEVFGLEALADETALRTCVLATRIGSLVGIAGESLADVYYAALLRFIGCTAYAHETAWRGFVDSL